MIRFSILTPCRDRKPFLRRMIASVVNQGGDDWEHIVADGQSTDGSLEELASHGHLQVISSPDHNLYEAHNKALAAARGEWVLFLNTDDVMEPGALEFLRTVLERTDADCICGIALFDEVGLSGRQPVSRRAGMSYTDVMLGVPVINARAFRRTALQELGGFDTSYRLAADRDLLLRFLHAGRTAVSIDRPIYRYLIHDGSLTLRPNSSRRLEIADEHRRLAAAWLRRPQIAKDLRRCAHQWYARETSVAALVTARAGRVGAAVSLLAKSLVEQPAWPFALMGFGMERLKQQTTQ